MLNDIKSVGDFTKVISGIGVNSVKTLLIVGELDVLFVAEQF